MTTTSDSNRALQEAVAKAGSQSKLAHLIGSPVTTVNSWLTRGSLVPANKVIAIEAATGVPRHDLRGDIYPREEGPADGTEGLAA